LREVVEGEVELFLHSGKDPLLCDTSWIFSAYLQRAARIELEVDWSLEHGEGGGTSTVAAPVLLNVVDRAIGATTVVVADDAS